MSPCVLFLSVMLVKGIYSNVLVPSFFRTLEKKIYRNLHLSFLAYKELEVASIELKRPLYKYAIPYIREGTYIRPPRRCVKAASSSSVASFAVKMLTNFDGSQISFKELHLREERTSKCTFERVEEP